MSAQPTQVYAPSAKALRNKAFNSGDRFVFLGDGTIATWNSGKLVQSDVLYKKPDCHCVKLNEPVPKTLTASAHEIDHVESNKIRLPFKLVLSQ